MRDVCRCPRRRRTRGGPVPPAGFVGRRALVVENDPAMREAFVMLLRQLGHGGARRAGVAEARAVAAGRACPTSC